MSAFRRPYYHYKCAGCGFPKPKDWNGLCPRCNPKQLEAYEEPCSRWTMTEWGVVVMCFYNFKEAVKDWLRYHRDRLSQYPITEIELPPDSPEMAAKVRELFKKLKEKSK